jgi:hypothetical protein
VLSTLLDQVPGADDLKSTLEQLAP